MYLKEWSWEDEHFVEVEYPDKIIRSFVEFMRTNNQWQDNPDLVVHRYRHLQKEMTNARNEAALAEAADACTAVTKVGRPCKNTVDVVDGLCHIHRRSLVPA